MTAVDDDSARQVIREALDGGATVEVAAAGLSMGTAFDAGARLVVKSADAVSWGCGDVVVFERGGRWIAHRVVWRWPAPTRSGVVCITKGDGVAGVDRPFLRAADVVGVVVGVIEGAHVVDVTRIAKRLQGLWIVLRGIMAMGMAEVFSGRGR